MFYAHSTDRADRSDWEPLIRHLEEVAALAVRFAEPLGLARAARLLGLLHDLGKFDPAFQRRLGGDPRSVDHSTAGAVVLLEDADRLREAGGRIDDRMMAEVLAQAIAGHHAGLPDDRSADPSSLSERRAAFDPARLDASWRDLVRPEPSDLLPDGFRFHPSFAAFQLFLLGRMAFSCLVDAEAWVETTPTPSRPPWRRVASRAEA